MLDNAKYHLVYDETVPKLSRMKKQELVAYLVSKEVPLHGDHSVLQRRNMARQWINENEKIAIVKTAEEAGHKVLLTAPYHSDLQPIELVWDLIKGNVGRKYSTETTLSIVHNHLMAEFERLEDQGHQNIGQMIEKCAEQAAAMYKEQLEMDEEADEYKSDTSQGDNDDIDQEDIGDSGEVVCEDDIEEKEKIGCLVSELLSCFGLGL